MCCAELPPTPAFHTSHLLTVTQITVICSFLVTADLYTCPHLSSCLCDTHHSILSK